MLKKRGESRLGVVAVVAALGGVFACSSSSSPGFPSSEGDGGTGSGSGGFSGSGSNSGSNSGGSSGSFTTSSSGTTTTSSSGTTTSSGTASSGTTSGTASSSGSTTPGCAYSGTAAAGAISFMPMGMSGMGGYQSTVGMGGYAYTFNDAPAPVGTGMCSPGAATACIDAAALCVSGTTGIASLSAPYNCYGAGFGINVGQVSGSPTAGTFMVPATSAGITYNLSGFPTIAGGGMRIQATVAGTTYCAAINSGMGMVPWTSLTVACYNSGGATLTAPPTALTNVEFTLDDGTAPTTYDICVTALSF